MDRHPDPQVEVELELARLFVGRNRVTEAGLEPPLADDLHVETQTAEEVGQVVRLRAVADLDLDVAKLLVEAPQTPPPPFSKSGQAAQLVKASPS
jgi:hypothetical protein